jgi:hypothetical protein
VAEHSLAQAQLVDLLGERFDVVESRLGRDAHQDGGRVESHHRGAVLGGDEALLGIGECCFTEGALRSGKEAGLVECARCALEDGDRDALGVGGALGCGRCSECGEQE